MSSKSASSLDTLSPVETRVRRAGRPQHGNRVVSPARIMFLSTMISAVLVSGILGGALAWENTAYVGGSTAIGAVDFELTFQPNAQLVTPTDGTPVRVGSGRVTNTGDYDIRFVSAEIEITEVTNFPACTPEMFTAGVAPFGALMSEIPKGAVSVNGFDVYITALPNVTPECNGASLSYATFFTFRAR